MNKGITSLLGGLLSAALPRKNGDEQGRLERREASVEGESYVYQVYVPAKVRSQTDPPLILFLHGINQRGRGGHLPTEGRGGALVRHYLDQVPAVVLLPQCSLGNYWSTPVMERMVVRSLDQTTKEFGVDSGRAYLAGVSMGGYGVWHVAAENPGRFAALVSICGGSPLRKGDRFAPIARKVGRTPAWLFHGSDDRVVPVSESRMMTAALREAGGDVRYSEYPKVGHNVWLQVIAERELLPWMLSKRTGKIFEGAAL